ncbi:MAG TPA: hypothetical protein VJ550_02965 [Geomonas sp.]|nr:hypothetical protein [Geomonas sp.]
MSVEDDELETLASEIQRLIKSNNDFLERVNDDEYDADGEAEESPSDSDEELEEFEEL